MNKYLAAIVQMDTSAGWEANLTAAEAFIDEAAAGGARLVAFPEHYSRYAGGRTPTEPVADSPTLQRMRAKAMQKGVWLLCGTMLTPAEDGRSYNTSLLLNPQGEIVGRFDKMHLFDVTLPSGEKRLESNRVRPGEAVSVVNTELGSLGMSVCYDLRFPELYRVMRARGAQVFLAPAMFSRETGQAHWEIMVRARAIENGCYVIAPNQYGGAFDAWGQSMIVDPWGKVLCEVKRGQGMAMAEIDLDYLATVRGNLPSYDHRRTDVYGA